MTTYRKEAIHDFEPAVYRHRGIMECRLNTSHISRTQFGSYLKQISQSLGTHSFHSSQGTSFAIIYRAICDAGEDKQSSLYSC